MHPQTEDLALYALGELPEEVSAAVETHLQTCVDCGIQFEESRLAIGQWAEAERLGYTGPEQRKSPRLETDDPAVLTVMKPERMSRMRIRILDASREGLKLLVPFELATGTFVQVHMRDLFILAEVRYSIPAGDEFHAGVLIHDVFPSSG